MSATVHRYAIRVRYGDTDKMGFAYHAHYLRWFEIGRVEFMRAEGIVYRDIEAIGVSLPVMEARCRYFKPAHYDDPLVIETGVVHCGRASVRFGYRILREERDPAVLAHGITEHCFINPEGRPVRPPRDLIAVLERAVPVPAPF